MTILMLRCCGSSLEARREVDRGRRCRRIDRFGSIVLACFEAALSRGTSA